MNAHERAAHLFIEAEKLGLDAPTEGMVADAIHDAECSIRTGQVFDLMQGGHEKAADYLCKKYEIETEEDMTP